MNVSNRSALLALACLGAGLSAPSVQAQAYTITNLVSDGSVPAVTVDPSLINPWGISYSATGPFWISDNNSSVSTVYNGAGSKIPLTVTIPAPTRKSTMGTPTGQVFNNSTSEFLISSEGKTAAAAFLFDTEGGVIAGWSPTINATSAIIAVDNSKEKAVYKGLAIATTKNGQRLYAANFRSGDVEIYNYKFTLIKTFTDTTLTAGYAPYNVQVVSGILYVTFAKQDKTKHDSLSGAGLGYVDAFNLDGVMLRRIVSGGPLNAPWGIDIAPPGFGSLAGSLLIGNFGDGWINAFDPATGGYKGPLKDENGRPIAIQDLWGLINGNGGSGGDANTVYFSAGLAGEAHGLFGSLVAATWTNTAQNRR